LKVTTLTSTGGPKSVVSTCSGWRTTPAGAEHGEAKQKEPLVQAAAQALIMAAEGRGPMHTAQAAASIVLRREDKLPKGKKPDRNYSVIK
jgi:hypothetical protein